MGRRAIESGRGSRNQSRVGEVFYVPRDGGFFPSDYSQPSNYGRGSQGGSRRVRQESRGHEGGRNMPRLLGIAAILGVGALFVGGQPEGPGGNGDSLTSRAVFPSATKAQETVENVAKYKLEKDATIFGAEKDAQGNITKITSLSVPVSIEYPDKNKLKEIDPTATVDKPEDLPPVHMYISYMCKYPDANAYQAPLKEACVQDLVAIVDEAMSNPLDYEAPAKAAFLDGGNDKVPKENAYMLKPCGTLDDDPNKINVSAYGIRPGPEPIEQRRVELTC